MENKWLLCGAEALWSTAARRSSSEARGEVRPGGVANRGGALAGSIALPQVPTTSMRLEGSMAQRRGEDLEGVMFLQLSLSSRKGLRLPKTSHLEPFFISY